MAKDIKTTGSGGRKSRGKRSKPENGTADANRNDDIVTCESKKNGNDDTELKSHKRPRRAATCDNFREKAARIYDKSSIIAIKEQREEDKEEVAVELTKVGPEDPPPCRKLVDFELKDADGVHQPLQWVENDDLYITAIIMPNDDNLEKDKEKGVLCRGFGRIEDWSISGYDEGSPVVWLSTDVADYECVKPAGSYKQFYDRFYEKARVCVEVYRKLTKSAGGNPHLSLEELLAAIVRSMGGGITKGFVISIGDFVFEQLIGLVDTDNNEDAQLASLPALLALRDGCKERLECNKLSSYMSDGTLKINEGGRENAAGDDDDLKYALLLQEEEDYKLRQKMGYSGKTASKKNVYIKISEADLANDYPPPAFYKPSVVEMDEYIFADDILYYDDLPMKVLNNWALYNSDSRFMSLELIPLQKGTENDVTIFGSGYMKEEDGNFIPEAELAHCSSKSGNKEVEGVAIYLSAIKEWQIEFGSSMEFFSIRTDVAWYRLGEPTKQYAPWFEPVLKTVKLAISIITMLEDQSRASKLSFSDVVKKVAEFKRDDKSFISSSVVLVERYILVHGQIIYGVFAVYPSGTIKKCAFVSTLKTKMEERRHTKLFMKKKVELQRGENLNPNASMGPIAKRKVMRATTTKMIGRIWGDYYLHNFPDDSREGETNDTKEIEEEQENEDDDVVEDETEPETKSSKHLPVLRSCKATSKGRDGVTWNGPASGKTASGEVTYRSALVSGLGITSGTSVAVRDDETEETLICYVEYMFEKCDGTKMVHGRIMQKGTETVLGNAANERDVFLTNECYEFDLVDVKEVITCNLRQQPWGHSHRKENAEADRIDGIKAEERKKKGLPVEYHCKFLYCPEKGAFTTLPYGKLGLGNGVCGACEQREPVEDEFVMVSKTSFSYNKVEYNINDFLYIAPGFFSEEDGNHISYKAGRNVGLKPYVICRLLEILPLEGSEKATPASTTVKLRRFYRPEDISSSKAYSSDVREVYYSEDTVSVPIKEIQGRCELTMKSHLPETDHPVLFGHQFFCERIYDSSTGTLKQLPPNVKLTLVPHKASNGAAKKSGKKTCDSEQDDLPDNRLSTLDIFAGCGGLSEGLQQAGATQTKWAIEYEEPAGEAFSENHPGASMFVHNCNVILKAIMDKCGDSDDCIATSDAAEQAGKLSQEDISKLPVPGEVDFINGGPPCQGFSGMNRFNQSPWSKVQCEMILAFLSFAEYFRPRYFLLENVRTFVSFNKGQTFRLTLASLLEMGYQVRFGILEAGAYGVSQSRKRAFIWAASPNDTLPEWPEPMHVFAGPELKVNMPGGTSYAAVKSTAGGAPYRSITVRDAIGDLPPVGNGASRLIIDYGSDPVSWFQKKIRKGMVALNDHVAKEMNELNLIRCQRIPKRPGSDWRDLPDEKVKLSSGQIVDLIPWCLPNTAKRHNQWKGLFGRLDWEGNFPTSITDPQPMGKVGMCFHPEQDRIITVRECARSQGFPDSYKFSGNIISKHKQIGNAVPPPLAYALGVKLKEALGM